MVRLPTHICPTQHQWVNEGSCSFTHPIVKGPRSWIRYVKHWCQDGDWHGLSIVMHVTAWSLEYHQDYSFATKIHTVMLWSLSGVDLLLLSIKFSFHDEGQPCRVCISTSTCASPSQPYLTCCVCSCWFIYCLQGHWPFVRGIHQPFVRGIHQPFERGIHQPFVWGIHTRGQQ